LWLQKMPMHRLLQKEIAAAQSALSRNIAGRVSAQNNLNSVTSVGTRLMSGALGLIGGIPGLVMLGAGAWYAVYQNQEQAEISSGVCQHHSEVSRKI
jgi:phage-related minor tail protein